MSKLAAVILAAGQGTRMKSSLPKVLHPICGKPLINWTLDSARALGADPIVLVIGHGSDAVRAAIGEEACYAFQEQRLGTGHAVLQAREQTVGRSDEVLVLYGNMPCLRPETLAQLVEIQRTRRSAMTLLSVNSADSMGFGRVVRAADGRAQAIVEEAAATPEIMALTELNCGVYCFDADFLWRTVGNITPTLPKNEYYLTDMVELAVAQGLPVEVLMIDDVAEVQGVNTRVHLANSAVTLRERINMRHQLNGVTLEDPKTTYIDDAVVIGEDTVIRANTHLEGATRIGRGCIIGPNCMISDTTIADGCAIIASMLESAQVDEDVHMGPFGHLRPGAHLGPRVKMGNFGEVKNATIGADSYMSHFSYVGDASVGERANLGAGTVTCNFNGKTKNRTEIGADAFIGSGSLLIAPVSVGEGSVVGAGSIVTHDVPDHTLAYGSPARIKRSLTDDPDDDQS